MSKQLSFMARVTVGTAFCGLIVACNNPSESGAAEAAGRHETEIVELKARLGRIERQLEWDRKHRQEFEKAVVDDIATLEKGAAADTRLFSDHLKLEQLRREAQ